MLAQHKETGALVAIKKMSDFFIIVEDAKRQLREILILRHLSEHPCVVKLLDIIEPSDR